MKGRKKTQQQVEDIVTTRGYELRSEYVNNRTKMDIFCPTCQNIFHATLSNFNSTVKPTNCPTCVTNARKIPFETVRAAFSARNLTLVSGPEDYENANSLLRYICICGVENTRTYHYLRDNAKCKDCQNMESSERRRLSPDIANKLAECKGLKNLEHNYKNMWDWVLVECLACGFLNKIKLVYLAFQSGECPRCKCSRGERQLIQFVTSLDKMEYVREYRFAHDPKHGSPGCVDKRDLPFDMFLMPLDGHEMAIEIDGLQHFQPVEFFGGEQGFENRRRKDIIKSIFCYSNRIPLLRISYIDLHNLDTIISDFVNKYRYNKHASCLMYSNIDDYASLISDINKAL